MLSPAKKPKVDLLQKPGKGLFKPKRGASDMEDEEALALEVTGVPKGGGASSASRAAAPLAIL
eukprot:4871111-Heterocapsa_arctica.AAC.1